jgi:hypothetical protein
MDKYLQFYYSITDVRWHSGQLGYVIAEHMCSVTSTHYMCAEVTESQFPCAGR